MSRLKGKYNQALPVPSLRLAQDLIRIYARLKGEIAKFDDHQKVLIPGWEVLAYMKYIQHLMPLLGVDFDPDKIAPMKTLILNGPLPHGEVRTGAFRVLKKRGDWMTVRKVADGVLAHRKVSLTPAEGKKFLQVMRESLIVMHGAGWLERESELPRGRPVNGKLQRYRLSPKRFRK